MGSIIIALNGPEEQSVSTIHEFQKLFLSPGFLVYAGLLIAVALGIIFFVAPKYVCLGYLASSILIPPTRYGKEQMVWYILVCSLFGGLSVSCTQGLGTAIVTTARGNNQVMSFHDPLYAHTDAQYQFKFWFTYFLLVFVAATLCKPSVSFART